MYRNLILLMGAGSSFCQTVQYVKKGRNTAGKRVQAVEYSLALLCGMCDYSNAIQTGSEVNYLIDFPSSVLQLSSDL